MTKDPLTKLAIKYKSDRHPWDKHSYTPLYYNLFKKDRKKIKKILEIGAGETTAGLFMWQDFFKEAKIYGAEIDPDRLITKDRIEVFLCDQSKKSDLENLVKKIGKNIDIVIDDGSHKPADQVFTATTLLPLLDKNTIYIIEDVADLNIINQLIDLFNIEIPALTRLRARHDDRLIILKQK